MLIFIGGPVLLFVLWDLVRRVIMNRRTKKEQQVLQAESAGKQQELEEMERELQRLRAQVNEGSANPGEEPVSPEKPE